MTWFPIFSTVNKFARSLLKKSSKKHGISLNMPALMQLFAMISQGKALMTLNLRLKRLRNKKEKERKR